MTDKQSVNNGHFKKGNQIRKGEKRGAGKFTVLKDWILEVAQETNAKEKLVNFASGTKHDQKWFLELWAKLQPKEIKGDVDATVKIIMEKIVTRDKPEENADG